MGHSGWGHGWGPGRAAGGVSRGESDDSDGAESEGRRYARRWRGGGKGLWGVAEGVGPGHSVHVRGSTEFVKPDSEDHDAKPQLGPMSGDRRERRMMTRGRRTR
eukprot:1993357-Rhodomonas_salina.1